MKRLDAISTRLQSKEIEILQKYYRMALDSNMQHFHWEKIDETLREEYPALKALSALGFVKIEVEKKSRGTVYDSYFLTLYPSAMHRAEFESYSKIKQWAIKNFLNYRDWMAIAAFIMSLILAVLKVIEFLAN